MYKKLLTKSRYLGSGGLIGLSGVSRSRFYRWMSGIEERRLRERKLISEEVVREAVSVIVKYPHFSGLKGQAYMIYHRMGYISQSRYKELKKKVRRLINQEVWRRGILPERSGYEHERARGVGEIWGADCTMLKVCGEKFNLSIVVDVYDAYTLGISSSKRINSEMIELSVDRAMVENGGVGPERFLLSDNGSQYVSGAHGEFLDRLEIVHKRIPACQPYYNGWVECGIKEFKNVFYNVWAELESRGYNCGKELEQRVEEAVMETKRRINEEIPRPRLGGVTPGEAHRGEDIERKAGNRAYLEEELSREVGDNFWRPDDWQLLKDSLFGCIDTNLELMTKFCFFLKRPLRKLTDLNYEVLGD